MARLQAFALRVGLLMVALVTTVLLHVRSVEASLSYPCPNTANSRPTLSPQMLPRLPDQFSVHVEANIVQKQSTSEAVEVYDYPNKRAVMSITTNNQTVTSIFNYETGERFDITPNGNCQTMNLSQSSFNVFGFTAEMKSPGRTSIMQAAEVFRFGDHFPKAFLGEEEVRGINVYHWQSCQTWDSEDLATAAYVIDYYFSKPGYGTATSENLIPVRVLINGTAINVDSDGRPLGGTHSFSHVYDFAFFRSGPVEDDSIFEIPRGTVCDRLVNKTMPTLPDQFSLSMEVHVTDSKRPPMTERMLFDYEFGLIQTDRFAPKGTGERFGLTQLTIVEDYKNQVQYVVDSYDGNCSVSILPNGLSTSDEDDDHISMKHGQQLLLYDSRDFKYQGQRWLRDLKVDVWAEATESGMVQEIYFLADWPSASLRNRLNKMKLDLDLSRMNILVGTYLLNTSAIHRKVGPFFQLFGDQALKQWGDRWQSKEMFRTPYARDHTLPRPGDLLRLPMTRRHLRWDSARALFPDASEKIINIFNYLPMHMDLSAFDVSTCYEQNAKETYVYFSLEGTYASVITNQRYLFISSTKSAVAKAAGISMLRITNVNVWQDLVSNRLNIFFSMLEPPPLALVRPQPSCQDAFQQLSQAVKAGLTITIKHPLKQTKLQVISDSLKSWDSLDHLWTNAITGKKPAPYKSQKNTSPEPADDDQKSSSSSGTSGYTSGEFGGMAFAMLVVGIVVGVVGMYLALRRLRPDIHFLPYQQSK